MIALNILSRFGFLALVIMPFSGGYRQPGPFTSFDVLHIRTSFTNGTIDVIDVSGRILHKEPVDAFTTDVPVGQLPNGIYFVWVRYDNNKKAVAKFVKN
jgi:hypothetical protein